MHQPDTHPLRCIIRQGKQAIEGIEKDGGCTFNHACHLKSAQITTNHCLSCYNMDKVCKSLLLIKLDLFKHYLPIIL